MSEKGWIKLHRQLLKSNCFQNEKLLKVWIWCLLKATHTGYQQQIGRQLVPLEPGQFPTGRYKAGYELGMNPSTAWNYLLLLKKSGNIDIKSHNKYSVVTVVNWAVYQGEGEELPQQTSQQIDSKLTTNSQQIDTNKNVKNVKNDKNDKKNYIPPKVFADNSPELSLTHEFLTLITANNPNFKLPNVQSWASGFDKILRLDNRPIENVRVVMEWAQSDDFWKSNILSPDTLRKKFDTLYMQMNSRGKRVDKPQSNRPKSWDAIDQWYDMTKEGNDE